MREQTLPNYMAVDVERQAHGTKLHESSSERQAHATKLHASRRERGRGEVDASKLHGSGNDRQTDASKLHGSGSDRQTDASKLQGSVWRAAGRHMGQNHTRTPACTSVLDNVTLLVFLLLHN